MSPENSELLAQLLFSLNSRLSPTVFLGICNTDAQRQRAIAAVEGGSPRYKHLTVDLGPHEVYSLRDAIARFVPEEVKGSRPLEYVVHFIHLSHSLLTTREGRLEPTPLMQELNYERERLFHDYPFVSFLWESPEFAKRLFYDAGDLFTWLVDRYEFGVDEEAGMPVEEVPGKEPLMHRGADPKRLAQIERLERLLQQLNEDSGDTQKYLRERTDTLLSLGHECIKAFMFDKAEHYLMLAKPLVALHYFSTQREIQLCFYLGDLFAVKRDFSNALTYYKAAIDISILLHDAYNESGLYHQIGRVYKEQHKWEQALWNLHLSLELLKKIGNESFLGETYREIGEVYENTGAWQDALNNYDLALKWEEKSGNESAKGSTYHQIGLVYQKQNRWVDALANYNLSLKYKKKTKGHFEIGITYHQMGTLYESQQNWSEALRHYEIAIKWEQKGGHESALGATYYHIARVYISQKQWQSAIENCQVSLRWLQNTGDALGIGKAYHAMGIIYQVIGQSENALEHYQAALELKQKTADTYDLGDINSSIAELYEEQGLLEKASVQYRIAIDQYKQANNPEFEVVEAALARLAHLMNENTSSGSQEDIGAV